MGTTYPNAAPTLSGDVLFINRFLKDPLWIARALRTLETEQFVSDRLLTGQAYTENGSVGYEQDESIFADRSPRAVAPGQEYPLTGISTGPAQLANTVKWGQDAELTDEKIASDRYDSLTRSLRKLVNSSVQKIDSVALAAIASAVTQNTAASASWTTGTPNILRDIMKAQASILKLKQGYLPDTVFVDLDVFAAVTSDEKLQLLLARELPGLPNSPVQAGFDSPFIKRIGGVNWVTSPVAPISGVALLLDSKVFGTFVDWMLPSDGYVSADGRTQVKTIRDGDNDRWRIRARRVTVPVVLEPKAAWKITGVAA